MVVFLLLSDRKWSPRANASPAREVRIPTLGLTGFQLATVIVCQVWGSLTELQILRRLAEETTNHWSKAEEVLPSRGGVRAAAVPNIWVTGSGHLIPIVPNKPNGPITLLTVPVILLLPT